MRFKNIIWQNEEPNKWDLWLHKGKLRYFDGEWKLITGEDAPPPVSPWNVGDGLSLDNNILSIDSDYLPRFCNTDDYGFDWRYTQVLFKDGKLYTGTKFDIDEDPFAHSIINQVDSTQSENPSLQEVYFAITPEDSHIAEADFYNCNRFVTSYYLRNNLIDYLKAGVGIKIQPTSDNLGTCIISTTLDTQVFKVVSSLPTTGMETNKIYLVPNGETGDNKFTEWAYINDEWEKIGEVGTDVDLSEVVKTEQLYEALGSIGVGTGLIKTIDSDTNLPIFALEHPFWTLYGPSSTVYDTETGGLYYTFGNSNYSATDKNLTTVEWINNKFANFLNSKLEVTAPLKKEYTTNTSVHLTLEPEEYYTPNNYLICKWDSTNKKLVASPLSFLSSGRETTSAPPVVDGTFHIANIGTSYTSNATNLITYKYLLDYFNNNLGNHLSVGTGLTKDINDDGLTEISLNIENTKVTTTTNNIRPVCYDLVNNKFVTSNGLSNLTAYPIGSIPYSTLSSYLYYTGDNTEYSSTDTNLVTNKYMRNYLDNHVVEHIDTGNTLTKVEDENGALSLDVNIAENITGVPTADRRLVCYENSGKRLVTVSGVIITNSNNSTTSGGGLTINITDIGKSYTETSKNLVSYDYFIHYLRDNDYVRGLSIAKLDEIPDNLENWPHVLLDGQGLGRYLVNVSTSDNLSEIHNTLTESVLNPYNSAVTDIFLYTTPTDYGPTSAPQNNDFYSSNRLVTSYHLRDHIQEYYNSTTATTNDAVEPADYDTYLGTSTDEGLNKIATAGFVVRSLYHLGNERVEKFNLGFIEGNGKDIPKDIVDSIVLNGSEVYINITAGGFTYNSVPLTIKQINISTIEYETPILEIIDDMEEFTYQSFKFSLDKSTGRLELQP